MLCHVIITWYVDISIKRFSKDQWSFWCIVCAYSMHGSGDNQPNVQKSKIQSYSVEHCTILGFMMSFGLRPRKHISNTRMVQLPYPLLTSHGTTITCAVHTWRIVEASWCCQEMVITAPTDCKYQTPTVLLGIEWKDVTTRHKFCIVFVH